MKCFVSCLIVGLTLLFSITGCASTPILGETAVLRGMVYNENRMPVLDVSVDLVSQGKIVESTLTDLHGRYFLSGVPYGKVSLLFTKPSYEPFTWTFSFVRPTQIVYIQMSNFEEILDDFSNAIQKREWLHAKSYFLRLQKLRPDNSVSLYLESIMLTRQGEPRKAVEILEKMSKNKEPIFAVELTLADLYQYKLSNPGMALFHLEKALRVQDDVDIKSRIKALETQIGESSKEKPRQSKS
ncbi:MAG: carboxypeptidase regulatory-like domain-containing protein [Spirochaetales bacterium]|nr:carboxypeptidase regulatory-like domain-containing protein [Spirochaetales bacterium]